MRPKVSIVMPAYNCEEYVVEALDSLLCQSYQNFEIICVDDGSTDNTFSILKNYEDRDARISVMQQSNQYAGAARNNGMKLATGKYLMFLDADDVFKKNMLSYCVKKAEKSHADIVSFGFYQFKNNIKNRSMMGILYHSRKVISPTNPTIDIFHAMQGVPWNKLYNREFIINSGVKYQEIKNYNDQFFVKIVALEANKILFLNKRFVYYRVNNNKSLSYRANSENLTKSAIAMYDALKRNGKYECYKDSFENDVLRRYLANFSKCPKFEDFIPLYEEMRKSFQTIHITEETPAVVNHPARDIWCSILKGKMEEALFNLSEYMFKDYCPKTSIEYRIGKKIIKFFKIKQYE